MSEAEPVVLRADTLKGEYFQNADYFVKVQSEWDKRGGVVYKIYFNPNASEDMYISQSAIAIKFPRYRGYGMFLDVDTIVEEQPNKPSSASLVVQNLENVMKTVDKNCSRVGSYYFKLPTSQAEEIRIQDEGADYTFQFIPSDTKITEDDLIAYLDKRLQDLEPIKSTYREQPSRLTHEDAWILGEVRKTVLGEASQLTPFYKTKIQEFQQSPFAVAKSYSLTAEDTKMVLPTEFRIVDGQDAKYFLAAVASDDPIVIIHQPDLQTVSVAHILAPTVLASSLNNFIEKSISRLDRRKVQVTILGSDHTRVVSYLCHKFEKEGFRNITAISSKDAKSDQLRIAIDRRNGKLCTFQNPSLIMTAPDRKRLELVAQAGEPVPIPLAFVK